MNEAEIEDLVARSGLEVEPRTAVTAVLNTLGEVLPYGVAGYLSANLPPELRPTVGRHFPVDQRADPVGRNEFMAAVVVRAQVHASDAERLITAVFEALDRALPAAVMNHVRQAVPHALDEMVGQPGIPQAERQPVVERPRAVAPEAEKETVRQVSA